MKQNVAVTNKGKDLIEQSAKLTNVGGAGVPTRAHSIFYNPEMKHQRDVFVAVVDSFKRFVEPARALFVGLPMEASGVRAIRLSKECKKRDLLISANDYDDVAIESLRNNCKQNGVTLTNITQLSSDSFFAQSKGFDIIDIDPFGGPGPHLDMAIKKIARGGLLCVTATDSAVLCGLYPSVALRSYWSRTSHDMSMHEWAVRILVRYCQLIGAQYDRALVPVLCYKKDHYVRLYLQCKKSKEEATSVVDAHGSIFVNSKTGEVFDKPKTGFNLTGPVYLGPLVDLSAFDEKTFRLHASDDSWVDRLFCVGDSTIGYYTIPVLCSLHNVRVQPSVDAVIIALRAKKYFAYVSLDEPQSIKSNCGYKNFVAVLKKVGNSNRKSKK